MTKGSLSKSKKLFPPEQVQTKSNSMFGNYTCLASNDHGRQEQLFILKESNDEADVNESKLTAIAPTLFIIFTTAMILISIL